MNEAAKTEARAKAGDVVALTQLLVRTPSVNPVLESGGSGERSVAVLCASWLDGWGYATQTKEVAPGRWNVVAEMGSGSPVTLLNGHLDTVGVAGMSIDPHSAELREGRLWGRGSADMKGGVAAILAAAQRFANAGTKASGTVVVALTADEEHASLGMQALLGEPRDDGPLVADRAVVCEPTSLGVMPAHKGFLWLTARFSGVAAHGSRPEVGVDAVRHAGLYMAALETLHTTLSNRPHHPLLGPASFHYGRLRGGVAPSVYPDACTLEIERRTLPHEGREVEQEFTDALATLHDEPGLDVTLDVDLYRPGSDVPSDAPVVTSLLQALAAEGLPQAVEGMTAWVDAAFLNEAGIPAVCFGPGSIDQAHTADEFVEVEQLQSAAAVLARLLGV